MRVYLAGVMQASRTDFAVESQSYRDQICQALWAAVPEVDVIDPWKIFPNSPDYDDDQMRQTLSDEFQMARTADLLIAYLPHASMGTAIEMWLAFEVGVPIIVVSPMTHNWVIRATAAKVLPDLPSLLHFVKKGGLQAMLL